MRCGRRVRKCGWIAGAVAAAALIGAPANGQGDAAAQKPLPPAFAEQQAAAEERPFAVMMGNKGLEQPGIDDLLHENRQQYQTFVLASELRFCRSACGLTNERCQKIAARAGVLIEPAVLDSAKAQERAQKQGGIRRAERAGAAQQGRGRSKRSAKARERVCHTRAAARYQAEKTKRAARAKETAIDALVARLDRSLVLSTGQRAQLAKILESNWDDEWGVMHTLLDEDDGPLPAIPDRLVSPCLNPTQQRLWRREVTEGIDATEAYVAVLCDIMDGLPSEFEETLDQALPGKPRPELPAAKLKNEVQKKP